MFFIKKKGYVYHFRNVLSQFNKNNGIKGICTKGKCSSKRLFYGSHDWAKDSEKLLTQNLAQIRQI